MNQTADMTTERIGTEEADDSVMLGVVYLLVGISVMMANGSVVYTILRNPDLRNSTTLILVCLAVFDFLIGFTVTVFFSPSAFYGRPFYASEMKEWVFWLFVFVMKQSGVCVALTAIDRWISIAWPLKYNQFVTTNRLFALLGILNVFQLLAMLIYRIFNRTVYTYNADIAMPVPSPPASPGLRAWSVLQTVTVPVLSFLIIVVCFVRIVTIIQRNNRRVRATEQRAKAIPKYSVTIIVSTAVFVVCHVPMFTSIGLQIMSQNSAGLKIFTKFSYGLMFSNSLWNVVIYSTMYMPFRRAMLKSFCPAWYRKRLQNEIGPSSVGPSNNTSSTAP